MKPQSLGLGVLFIVGLILSGCDSGQYGESTPTEPKSENALMLTTEHSAVGEPSTMGGSLLATAGSAGAKENDEGVTHFQQEHWDVAQEHFNKALAINPDLPEGQYNLALALDKLGNHGEATNHFKMALKLAPEDPRIKDSGILKAHVGG
jgi:Flp pilus assembly protein TadD